MQKYCLAPSEKFLRFHLQHEDNPSFVSYVVDICFSIQIKGIEKLIIVSLQ